MTWHKMKSDINLDGSTVDYIQIGQNYKDLVTLKEENERLKHQLDMADVALREYAHEEKWLEDYDNEGNGGKNYEKQFPIPKLTEESWKKLQNYLNSLADIIADLEMNESNQTDLTRCGVLLGMIDVVLGRTYDIDELKEIIK